jgi:uracil-DNA glycosylase family 4
LDETK